MLGKMNKHGRRRCRRGPRGAGRVWAPSSRGAGPPGSRGNPNLEAIGARLWPAVLLVSAVVFPSWKAGAGVRLGGSQ